MWNGHIFLDFTSVAKAGRVYVLVFVVWGTEPIFLSRNVTVQILTHTQSPPLFAKVAAQQEAQQDKVRISITHNGGMNVQLLKERRYQTFTDMALFMHS